MITAKDALNNALESEYVKNWLEEVNREIIKVSVSGQKGSQRECFFNNTKASLFGI